MGRLIIIIFSLLQLNLLHAQQTASLTRYKKSGIGSIKVPLTKYCFVREAGITKDFSNGWIMQWDLVQNPASNLLSDSLWEIQEAKASLKRKPYTGKFRFWVSQVDKAGYSRTTYAITDRGLVIKEGPYDFIYLAKNYSKDHVSFKRPLNEKEKELLADIGQQIGADTLKQAYTNFCIIDGLILSCSFESAAFSKDVTVSNYYNESIAKVVEFINGICPEKYRIWYDKEFLLKQQKKCKL